MLTPMMKKLVFGTWALGGGGSRIRGWTGLENCTGGGSQTLVTAKFPVEQFSSDYTVGMSITNEGLKEQLSDWNFLTDTANNTTNDDWQTHQGFTETTVVGGVATIGAAGFIEVAPANKPVLDPAKVYTVRVLRDTSFEYNDFVTMTLGGVATQIDLSTGSFVGEFTGTKIGTGAIKLNPNFGSGLPTVITQWTIETQGVDTVAITGATKTAKSIAFDTVYPNAIREDDKVFLAYSKADGDYSDAPPAPELMPDADFALSCADAIWACTNGAGGAGATNFNSGVVSLGKTTGSIELADQLPAFVNGKTYRHTIEMITLSDDLATMSISFSGVSTNFQPVIGTNIVDLVYTFTGLTKLANNAGFAAGSSVQLTSWSVKEVSDVVGTDLEDFTIELTNCFSVANSLHTGNIFHFPMNETSGGVLIDAVAGAELVQRHPDETSYRFAQPKAVTFGYVDDGDADAIMTKFDSGIQRNSYKNAQYIVYGCAYALPLGTEAQEGTIDAKRLIMMVDEFGSTIDNSLGAFYQYKRDPPLTGANIHVQNLSVFQGDADFNNLKFAAASDIESRFMPDKLIGYCLVVEVGKDATPRFILNDGYKIDFAGDTVDTTLGTVVGPQVVGIYRCDSFVQGMLMLDPDAVITDADMAACALFHHTNAPLGDKRVWDGWKNFAAATPSGALAIRHVPAWLKHRRNVTFSEGESVTIRLRDHVWGNNGTLSNFAAVVDALPPSLTLNTVTGDITGVPAVGESASSPYDGSTFTADNELGTSAPSWVFDINIIP